MEEQMEAANEKKDNLHRTVSFQQKGKSLDSFKSIGSRLRGMYNFCQAQFAPDVKTKEHWRRLKRKPFTLGNEDFPGFYSEFDPRITNVSFWLTVILEGLIAIYLAIYGMMNSGFSAIVFFPALTLFFDIALATIKHVLDHKYAEWENARSIIRITNVDYIGKKSKDPDAYDPKKRMRQLTILQRAVDAGKIIVIALLVWVAYQRIGIFIEHVGPAMTKWMSIPYLVVKVIGYVFVASTTLLHVVLTGRFFWNRWFQGRVGKSLDSIRAQKYDSNHAIQWPRVRLIEPGFGDKRGDFSNMRMRIKNHDVANTNHGIRVVGTENDVAAFIIQHGVLEDNHIKELANSVESDTEIRALVSFLIKECQLDTVKEDETNQGNFVAFDEYPNEIRIEVLRRYRDFLLFQDEDHLRDQVLVTHKKFDSNHKQSLLDIFTKTTQADKGRYIVDLITTN